jgi:thymidine phosphorylase
MSAPDPALVAAALAARAKAYAPYSKFLVGAAVRDAEGTIHAGCNVENAAYPEGTCAEAGALAAMVLAGGRRVVEAVVAGGGGSVPCTPCGGCRQKLREFSAQDTPIHVVDGEGRFLLTLTLAELLPHGFGPDTLSPCPPDPRKAPVPMIPQEIIRRKRDGQTLTGAEIGAFIAGLTDGSVGDGQAAAFAMAVFFRGMTMDERVALTLAMRDSGTVLNWAKLGLDDAPIVDKHSTGGVGDKVSLMLAPMVAARGAHVPMISGRGLGHTGGTLDKFDSIPGYRTAPDLPDFAAAVKAAGCAVIGQTADLAPADRRLYAIRDVTATVESLPLITASILSKKLAAGLSGLAMDVKFGNGAFMADPKDAYALAESIATVARGAGLPTVALLTDMDQVLGDTVGNALEMAEAIAYLTGAHREARLHAVTLALAAEMLVLAKRAPDLETGRALAQAALDDGTAAEAFARMVTALGGPADLLERPEAHLAPAPLVRPLPAPAAGVVAAMDTRSMGLALVEMGGGRTDPKQAIDHAVGMTAVVKLGQTLAAGDPLCVIHARDEAGYERAAARIRTAITLAEPGTPVTVGPPVTERLDASAPLEG